MARIKPPPRPDGYYWTLDLRWDTVFVMLYRDGRWHDPGEMPEKNVEVLAGPLPLPTDGEMAGQAAHFAEQCRWQAAYYGIDDPIWDGAIEGTYWVRRRGKREPEIAFNFEGSWGGLNWKDDAEWATSLGEPTPEILFGPLVPPPGYRRFEP